MSNDISNTIDAAKADGELMQNNDTVYYSSRPVVPDRMIFYLCDKKKCGISCDGECKHTSDISHAKHYMSVPPNKTLEKHFREERMILDRPTIMWFEEE